MFKGIVLPLITPFTENGDVDEPLLLSLIDSAVESGVNSIFLLGSQGQAPTLSLEERIRTAEIAIQHMEGRLPVIIHVGTTDLRSTLRLTKEAEKAGATAVAVIPPYYYTDHPSAEIDAHFLGVADNTELPMFVYNNAKYAGVSISPEWLARLAEKIPQLQGVKLSYASPEQVLEYVSIVPDRVSVFSGSAMNLLLTAPFGVKGAINPLSVLFPDLAVASWKAIDNADWNRAFELQGAIAKATLGITKLVRQHGRPVYQEGLRMLGFNVKMFPRWKSLEFPEKAKEELKGIVSLVTDKNLLRKQ